MPSEIPPKTYTDDAAPPERVEAVAIGVVRSPHKERHGTPRQAVLAADAAHRPVEGARIELFAHVVDPLALADLEAFEMLWVVSWLHLNHGWRPQVTPPGEATARGLFATRAPHRPNPIGLSAVKIERVVGLVIHVARIDLLDGTPVLDLKPYVPYADAFPDVKAGWLDARPAIPDR